jgi:hypothetical protein
MRGETPIQRRVLDIRAKLAEQHDEVGDVLFVAIICNDCETTQSILSDEPGIIEVFFDGWLIDNAPPYHDLCPACARRR